jgi:hypothetical protein
MKGYKLSKETLKKRENYYRSHYHPNTKSFPCCICGESMKEDVYFCSDECEEIHKNKVIRLKKALEEARKDGTV